MVDIPHFYLILENQPNDLEWKLPELKTKPQLQQQQNLQKSPSLQPSISMDIFHIQTIKASGLSIRLKAANIWAKRDVSISHNLMYTF